MKQINWRHVILLALMAVGLCLVGGNVDNDAAFFVCKVLGLGALWAMNHLFTKWLRAGKIKNQLWK